MLFKTQLLNYHGRNIYDCKQELNNKFLKFPANFHFDEFYILGFAAILGRAYGSK